MIRAEKTLRVYLFTGHGTDPRQSEIQLFPAFVGSLHVLCEIIPNIEVPLEKAYSETIFWRKDIRSLVASPPKPVCESIQVYPTWDPLTGQVNSLWTLHGRAPGKCPTIYTLTIGMQQKESEMNVRRLQGLALIVSAVCFLLGLFGPQSIALIGPQATSFYVIVGIILFMLGIPAVYLVHPTGWIGLAGIVLLELASFIAVLFRLNMMPSGLAGSLSLTSALAGMLGAVIIGWLTTREHVFPAWVGWGFIAQGLLNFFTGVFNLGNLMGAIPIFLPILSIIVQFAYGYFIYQKATKLAIAGEAKVPLA